MARPLGPYPLPLNHFILRDYASEATTHATEATTHANEATTQASEATTHASEDSGWPPSVHTIV